MALVECPKCNQEFDPEAQDGLCTNSGCGQYRYDPDGGGAGTDDPTTDDDTTDGATTGDDPVSYCPSCGGDIGDENFCPQCGHEFGSVSETQECGACHETVPQRTYCRNCGTELSTVVTPKPVCPECDTNVGPDDNFCSECGEPLDDPSEELVLEFKGQQAEITDGKLVGAKLRDYAHEDGADWDVARRIHRKHVKFVATDSGFDLVAVDQDRDRQNNTYLNGDKLAPGERRSLEVGDEIGFHDVGTGVVREG